MPKIDEKTRTDTLRQLSAINPMFVWWSLPAIMMEGWLCAMTQMVTRTDNAERNPASGDAQLPVPANLQDHNDRELFA